VEQNFSVCLQDKKKAVSDERVTNRTSVFAEKLCIGITIIIIIIIMSHESLNWWRGRSLILTGRHFFSFFVAMEVSLVNLDIGLLHKMASILESCH
jgi:hypothetical protein